MNKLLFCKFNIYTGNVECRFADATMVSIDCDAMEAIVDHTLPFIKVRTELDWLIPSHPIIKNPNSISTRICDSSLQNRNSAILRGTIIMDL